MEKLETAKYRRSFAPAPTETVENCLKSRVAKLDIAIEDWRKFPTILLGDVDLEELTLFQKQTMVSSAMYLRKAYQLALANINGEDWSWQRCCEESIAKLNESGITKYEHWSKIYDIQQVFKKNERLLPPRQTNGKGSVEFFNIFPEAHDMLYRYGKENLESLSCEKAHLYLIDTVVPHLKEKCNEELEAWGEDPLTTEEFLAMCKLKMLCVSTVWRWLRLLGFEYKANTKTYYTDGHERPDNVKYRMVFISRYRELEKRCYRWAQVPEDDAVELEEAGLLSADTKHYEKYG